MRYLEATLVNGDKVIGEFRKLLKVQGYVNEVFAGEKPFNVWKKVGDTLPSGEKGELLTREMYSGNQILSIREVVAPTVGADAVAMVPRGPRGRFTIRTEEQATAAGVAIGTQFPKHKDPRTLDDYIILKVEGDKETRLFTESLEVMEFDPTQTPALPDADDDDEDEGDDDDFGGGSLYDEDDDE